MGWRRLRRRFLRLFFYAVAALAHCRDANARYRINRDATTLAMPCPSRSSWTTIASEDETAAMGGGRLPKFFERA